VTPALPTAAASATVSAAAKSAPFFGRLSQHRLTEAYSRTTFTTGYRGRFELELAAHALSVRDLETYRASATSFRLGGREAVSQSVALTAHAGAFTAGTHEAALGDAAITWTLPHAVELQAGYDRRPLALVLPLVKDELALMRDAIYGEVRWGRIFCLRSELQQERQYAAHEYHELIARLPLAHGRSASLAMRIPASYEAHPHPNPNYAADARSITTGLGLELAHASPGWQGELTVDYGSSQELAWGAGRPERRVGLLVAAGSLHVMLGRSVALLAEARMEHADEVQELRVRDEPDYLLVGLALLHL